MAGFEHLIQSYDVGDLLDEIASADPPAYLRRCFAEGLSAPALSWARVQQLAVCAMVLDAIVNDRDYEFFERELIADWRVHYAQACMQNQGHGIASFAARARARSTRGRRGRGRAGNSGRIGWQGPDVKHLHAQVLDGLLLRGRRAAARLAPPRPSRLRRRQPAPAPLDASYDWHVLVAGAVRQRVERCAFDAARGVVVSR